MFHNVVTNKNNPIEVMNVVLDRVREIMWYNRYLTRLTNPLYFKNGEDFVKNKIIEVKGPYLENIQLPAEDNKSFTERAKELNLSPVLVSTIKELLFGGSDDGRLYKHQWKAIQSLIKDNKNLILSVPTATGKTESFLIPILEYCIQSKKEGRKGLKAILIYPQKTLGNDQLNRIIEYLYFINNKLDDPIRIGIWDGDTPHSIVDKSDLKAYYNSLPEGTQVRGITCPEPDCNEKLKFKKLGASVVSCPIHGDFPWIHATRESIKDFAHTIDILITNPEAFDYLSINPSAIFGHFLTDNGKKDSVKYIVYDEAHVWSGISGANIQLLNKRLKYHFPNAQFVLLSATVNNPEYLLNKLTGEDGHVILFEGRPPLDVEANVSKLKEFHRFFNFEDVFTLLLLTKKLDGDYYEIKLKYKNFGSEKQDSDTFLDPLIDFSEKIGFTKFDRSTKKLILTDISEILLKEIEIESVSYKKIFSSQSIISATLKQKQKLKYLYNHIIEYYPYVFKLAFVLNTNFNLLVHIDKILKILQEWVSGYENLSEDYLLELLSSLLSFGRAIGIMRDRYHIFIRPSAKIYYCPTCKQLSTTDKCPVCEKETYPLVFCKKCHAPFFLKRPDNQDGLDKKQYYYKKGNLIAVPIIEDLSKSAKTHKLSSPDLFISYSAFASYLISAIGKRAKIEKILVFSDSRGLAEGVADNVLNLDYSLVVNALVTKKIEEEGEISILNLEKYLSETLKSMFIDPLYDIMDSDVVREKLQSISRRINQFSSIRNWRPLLRAAVVMPKVFLSLENNRDVAIAYEIFRWIYYSQPIQEEDIEEEKFDKGIRITLSRDLKREINIPGKPLFGNIGNFKTTGLVEYLYKRFKNWGKENVLNSLKRVLPILIDGHIIRILDEQTLKNRLDLISVEKDKEQVKAYCQKAKSNLEKFLNGREVETGFLAHGDKSKVSLILTNKIQVCPACNFGNSTIYPAVDDTQTICGICENNTELVILNRDERLGFSKEYNEKIQPAPWPLDHWSYETWGVSKSFTEIPYIKILPHRGGLDPAYRAMVEQAFREEPPLINVVSSTPTFELGIDIGSLSCIIQVGIPPYISNYVQRSGRAGRLRSEPSFVFTIIRTNNVRDNYFFSDPERFFAQKDDLKIPDVPKLEKIRAQHIVTEALIYLALSPDISERTYSDFYKIDTKHLTVSNFLERIKSYANDLTEFLCEHKESFRQYIYDVFGDYSFADDLFFNSSSQIYFPKVVTTFIDNILNDKDIMKNLIKSYSNKFIEEHSIIGRWLALVGLFAGYRGLPSHITVFSKNTEHSPIHTIEKDRAVNERFPGERGRPGAVFLEALEKRQVVQIKPERKLLSDIYYCSNSTCPLFLMPIKNPSEKECVLCHAPLEKRSVVSINLIIDNIVKRSSSTKGVSTIYVEDRYDLLPPRSVKIGKIETLVSLKKVRTVQFTPRFYKDGRLKVSEIPLRDTKKTPLTSVLRANKQKETKTEYVHVGAEDETEAVKIEIPIAELNGLLSFDELFEFIDTFNRALLATVSVVSNTEIDDINIAHFLSEDKITYYVIDKITGGSGLMEIIYNEIVAPKQHPSPFITELKSRAKCPHCNRYCEYCLMVGRDVEVFLKKNTLNRKVLEKIFEE